jgi:methionyl-tRNA formyltransferase
MLLKSETAIGMDETAEAVSERLAEIGAVLAVKTVAGLAEGTITPEPQDESLASWAPVLKREDGLISWESSAYAIHNRARGFRPWPGAYTTFRGQRLHIWRSNPHDRRLGPPGSIHIEDRKLIIACGSETALEIQELQLEGRKRVTAEAFVNGHRLAQDEMLGEKTN